jgi:mannose-6-phosphate isomerase
MKQEKNKIFRLQGQLRYYDWGGISFLSQLLHIPNPEGKPFAEYWMGAHDSASSEIVLPINQLLPLNQYIQSFTKDTLGPEVADQFGQLPYLLKILDVKRMLSIQVHPSKKNAEIEFLNENSRGIDISAEDRNYRDRNHKPELMLALSEFWLLHGFKPAKQLIEVLENIPELYYLTEVFQTKGYLGLYQFVMEMDQSKVNDLLQPLVNRLIPAYQENRLVKNQENFWVARASLDFTRNANIDRGIFSIYFFNLINLHPGEAIYQDAGLPHAYLEGQNIEIMANSDNVLRGGLSSKHIDVKELLKHVRFEETVPALVKGIRKDGYFQVFATPAPDFELSRIVLEKDQALSITAYSIEIYFVLSGQVVIKESPENQFSRQAGEAFISFDQAFFELAGEPGSILLKASVPRNGSFSHK